MLEMAIYRAPRARSRPRGAITAAARQAMQDAARALTDAVPALLGDDALAQRDRYRQEDERKNSAQRELGAGGKPWA